MGVNRFVSRISGARAWGILGSLVACTTPSFDTLDAGADDVGATEDRDAAPSTISALCAAWQGSSALPAGAAGLVGRYAMRIDSYGFDDIAAIHARQHEQRVWTADIAEREGQLTMELRLCDWHSSYGSLGTLLTATSAPMSVASMPLRSLGMTFGPGCSWSARPQVAQHWGYAALSPQACVVGGSLARTADQAWLPVSCQCASSDDTPPGTDQDCRVSDPDGDKQPGVTIEWKNEELGSEVYYQALRDESELVQGAIDASGVLTAHELRKLSIGHLGGDFPRMPSRCPDATSRVALKRLVATDGNADACTDALRAFWSEAEPEFPERECPGQ